MRFLLFLGNILWLSIAVGGVFYLAQYENTPADKNVSYPLTFPPESRLGRDAGRPTLLFFAHPKCPCTRASLRELERLTAQVDGRLQAYVVFIKPKGESEEWMETDLRTKAEAIPNVRVVIDEDERETRIFGAQTSGLTLLYDRDGNLRFDGGITAARAHEGDNAGSRAIFEIITKDVFKTTETAVFGCPLHKKDCQGGLMENTQ
ncbi:MAG TPA: hypothetical protein VK400_10680 [Pyrinomonadaceae bacterium]|nr:hypothetical protein [Pyrinomonadaceae bacterium]